MNQREVIHTVLRGQKPPYVPWSFGFTVEAHEKLKAHYGKSDLEDVMQNHLLGVGNDYGVFTDIGNSRMRDVFGVVWNRTVDKDIGNVEGCLLPEPTLKNLQMPDPLDPKCFRNIEPQIKRFPNKFRVFSIGFSLYERAWTMRGMENIISDFIENPEFVRQLLNTIADYNIAQVRKALEYDIDAVYFGDDWGQQHGLIMGPKIWREMIAPVLGRMYAEVRKAGKYVFIHSCGDVDELFDDLIVLGVNCFNPFQPEVMDVWELLPRYRGRLTFHGGLSTQRTLPRGTCADVAAETRRLLELGREGSYILSPAHAVEGDVPLENMLEFINIVQGQRGAPRAV